MLFMPIIVQINDLIPSSRCYPKCNKIAALASEQARPQLTNVICSFHLATNSLTALTRANARRNSWPHCREQRKPPRPGLYVCMFKLRELIHSRESTFFVAVIFTHSTEPSGCLASRGSHQRKEPQRTAPTRNYTAATHTKAKWN